ncbi:Alpha/Beta hydrolase protein [Clohesyomyces aquaticus]|uniref:Alpha/Beta hydrolase protein n=1 Tax=Clohesyomyces aquaticus TaxID=1231657 RepID=A0A1Y1ZP60_9PLEO|nr:Alpha/Beta hydrolase protein [Clohesyomyces aquaticus]
MQVILLAYLYLVCLVAAIPNHPRHWSNITLKSSWNSRLVFSPCPGSIAYETNLQCATLHTPVDWDEPEGEQFGLGVVKLPAPSNSTSKIGSLFLNFGGPGESVFEWLVRNSHDPTLRNAFDLIGVDPRGTGRSQPIQCNMSILQEDRVTMFPSTQKEFDRLVDRNKRFGESCWKRTGPLFEHMDTISVAKDHEAARVAIGSPAMNFLGFSYGTQIGAQYAQLYPDNIRTMALDGIALHSQDEATKLLIGGISLSAGMKHFFEWASTDNTSPLKGQDVEALWNKVVGDAWHTPIPAPDCDGTNCRTNVTLEEFLDNWYIATKSDWGERAELLWQASQGNASEASDSFGSPALAAGVAVSCSDFPHQLSNTLAGITALKTMANVFIPLTRGMSIDWTLQHRCVGWPVAVKNPPKKLDVQTNSTILLVSSDADPNTGYPMALGLKEQMRNAVLVTRHGDGHCSFYDNGETTQVMMEYLITGKAPPDGLVLQS